MDARKAIITDIFNTATLIEVPFFQRTYVWQEDLWERLLEDMKYVVKTNRPHFLGSIILKEGKQPTGSDLFTSRKTIVDGQQRMTTFLILLKALCLKQKQESQFDFQFRIKLQEIALQHGKNDIEAFEKVMNAKKAEKIEQNGIPSRIVEAFNYYIDCIDETELNYNLILMNTQFVRIDLTADEDEQQIFDTINFLGVSLTTSELLKNYFFSRETVADYNDKWASVFEKDDETRAYWDTEIEAGRMKKALIDIFFDAFFQMFTQDKKYQISAEDRISYNRLDRLALSYQHFINTYCNGDKNVVLNELKAYATCFMETFNPDYCTMNIPGTKGLERLNVIIFGLKTTTLIPYVLYITRNVKDQDVLDKMYGILESYIMRRMVVHATTKNYNRMIYSLLLSAAKDPESLADFLTKDEDATTYFPSDEELLVGFEKSRLTNLQTRGIIYLIESYIRPASTSTTLLGFDSYSLEHLMPKKWRNNWEKIDSEEKAHERDVKLLTLGNLAIITQSLNSSIRDGNWTTKLNGNKKKPGLKECAAGLTTMFDVLQRDEWTEEDIDNRAAWLFARAKELWSIE